MSTVQVIGVDLGGTSVRAAVIDESGKHASETFSLPSLAEAGSSATLDVIASVCLMAINESPSVLGIGIAIPGHIDDKEGTVRWSPNFGIHKNGVFEYWNNVQIREPLFGQLSLPITMANDANAAALGEYKFGSGKGSARCLVMLTLGTGIGGGVVLGSQSVGGRASGPLLLLGGNKGGVELGHTVIARGGLDSSSGAYGTVEAYCQRDSIVRRAQNKLIRGRNSVIRDLVGGELSLVTPEVLSRAAEQNDKVAIEVWRETGEYLGTAIGSMINVFAPDVFAVGGQISLAGDHLLLPAIAEAERVAIPSLFTDCRITVAEKMSDAGVLGAAALALETL